MRAAAALFVLTCALAAYADTAVVIETDAGTIEAVLYEKQAPLTVANFLTYVDARHYDGGRFHRTVRTNPDNQPKSEIKIDVIQAGVNPAKAKEGYPPIPLERTNQTGLAHTDGALSMARSEPSTATSDFFICIGDQPALDFGGKRNPDGQGFAVFGRITKGMDVVRKIHVSPSGPSGVDSVVQSGDQNLKPPIRILSIRRK